ncbi:IS256 family transposase [Streptomyces sp. NRRL B-24484]|uniref:IS256 family transposase n=1 Tax=Streptomyces sp. NRRL B-24484 TaxID=1463833 RepID=UPI003B638B5D
MIASVEAVEEVRPVELSADLLDDQLIGQLVDRARASGLQLTGEGGLLQQLTKRVLESALEGETTDHLGYEKHDRAGAGSGNSRNGVRAKTVLTDVGPVEIEVPRDREGSFDPQIVKKRQRRLTGVDEMVLSLSARGLTHGDISAHLAEVYGASVSKSTISTITDKVMDGMAEWQNGPLDAIYPVIFIDCIHVKVRDGQVANRPIYIALAVTVDGTRDILGLWAGDGGEGAKYWLQVLTEIKNRGVEDVCMVVCDGLKGLPDAIGTVWPQAITRTCVVHLMRASFRYAARQDWDKISRALKPICTAPTADAAEDRFLDFQEEWGAKYPAIVRLWSNAWAEFVPFLQFDAEIRRVVCTTNAIESVNARIRKAVRARGHFLNEAAALKCVYMAVMSLDPTGQGRKRWTMRWKPALQAFDIAFDGRLSLGRR